MTPESDPVEALFAAALAKPAADRDAYLQDACRGDDRLRERVLALLQAHAEAAAEAFLTGPYHGSAAAEVALGPGTRVGPYKLLQQIGEGGMGVVFLAEQEEPVRRRVALKIIKPGLDSGQVIARFEAERQALSLMDHPNIAKVLDAGTIKPIADCRLKIADLKSEISNLKSAIAAGRPYFVMELVHGIPITQFCDRHHLSPRQRLELFVPVCQAIQHAHQKGIIHRDVKPSNVLVTLYDDKPVPKVIDFGVAKAIEQRLTEKTLFTQFGAFVGTLEYMSPEQAEMNQLGVDTRSDIYSLGVLLYELLTGTTPLERARLRQAALDEVIRLIREEEPPRPSARLSSVADLPTVAAARQTEPGRLATLLRGELDWIVMRCLEKDRARRYETASALARDAERYLHDEPVEACPPSAAYRLRKFARKHRGPLIAAGLVFLALVGGLIGTVVGWERAVESETREREAKVEAQSARDELEGALARSMISPLDPDGKPSLNLAEWETCWQLAMLDNDRVRRRYLEIGLANELTASQLAARAEWVVRALVGLDDERRKSALEQVMHALNDPSKSQLHRLNIALLGLELADRGSGEQREFCMIVRTHWADEKDEMRRWTKTGQVLALAERLEPELAVSTLSAVADQIEGIYSLGPFAQSLLEVAARLPSSEATDIYRLAAKLLAISQGKEQETPSRYYLADRLSEVAARLPPTEGTELLAAALAKEKEIHPRSRLAMGLSAVATGLPPTDATRICDRTAKLLSAALDNERNRSLRGSLAEGLSAVAARLPPADRVRICGRAAQLISADLDKESDANSRRALIKGLSAVTSHLPPADGAKLLAAALDKDQDGWSREHLATGLSAVAAHVPPAEAARFCRPAAKLLCAALEKEKDSLSRAGLATGLSAVATHVPPAEAARFCQPAAELLSATLHDEKDSNLRGLLAEGLSALAAHLPPADGARLLSAALDNDQDGWSQGKLAAGLSAVALRMPPADGAKLLSRSLEKQPFANSRTQLAAGLSATAARLQPAEATEVLLAAAATEWKRPDRHEGTLVSLCRRLDNQAEKRATLSLMRSIVSSADLCAGDVSLSGSDYRWHVDAVNSLLPLATHAEVRQRAAAQSAVLSLGAGGSWPGLALLSAACEPLPCRFSSQELVDLLKMPTCVGPVRRLILDQLGNRYHRRFASQWDFVLYAREHGLNLDFTTPPKRPPRTLPPWPGR